MTDVMTVMSLLLVSYIYGTSESNSLLEYNTLLLFAFVNKVC